jgi:hypothetical protein
VTAEGKSEGRRARVVAMDVDVDVDVQRDVEVEAERDYRRRALPWHALAAVQGCPSG